MCGIVGAVAQRGVADILLEGLKRLEYRGYDSAGIVVIDKDNLLQRHRTQGKVRELELGMRANHFTRSAPDARSPPPVSHHGLHAK